MNNQTPWWWEYLRMRLPQSVCKVSQEASVQMGTRKPLYRWEPVSVLFWNLYCNEITMFALCFHCVFPHMSLNTLIVCTIPSKYHCSFMMNLLGCVLLFSFVCSISGKISPTWWRKQTGLNFCKDVWNRTKSFLDKSWFTVILPSHPKTEPWTF